MDVFISISGPEPSRSSFERLIRKQLEGFEGRVVISLGKPEESCHGGPNLKSYLSRKDREELLNRSRIVVARSGYSTIMDLFSLRKRGFLIPTPGQLEQEYLADYHMRRRTFYSVPERELDLPRQLEEALAFHPPTLKYPTERGAVQNAVGLITQTARLERAQMMSVR